jgi:hypothetical protein
LTQIQTYNFSYATINITATVLTTKYSQVSQDFSRPHNQKLINNTLVTTDISNANGSWLCSSVNRIHSFNRLSYDSSKASSKTSSPHSAHRFECVVGGVRRPQHTQTCSNSSTIAAESSNGVVTNTRCCRYSCMRSWWWVEVPPETVEQFPDINKLCNVASCWIYEHTGILLGDRPILHINKIKVKT